MYTSTYLIRYNMCLEPWAQATQSITYYIPTSSQPSLVQTPLRASMLAVGKPKTLLPRPWMGILTILYRSTS